ncbi:ubiquitin carboxyl-terminal hydrolase 40 isoform X2 [Hemibagrus wyckioides]|uniref:ubiquitin carboxyl-terminal hydrolase 40 isoform X2 n=1 Tax=Hemibagrus wyckioides TaxID=337641 RepID=UPI00266D8632|nr:ubiquitin carboxyl-terminal hydrolase 40 isoform X2 [Hemibagrus wyckioides]
MTMSMFGDLFEEEEESTTNTTTNSINQGKGKVCEPPPPPRGKLKLIGIRNQGSTCYLNSLLQTLLHTPEFREELFRLGPEELGKLGDKDKPDAKVRVIPLELQNLFARLLLLDEQTTTTTALTESFGWTNSETAQQDVQELNRILFSALESSLIGTSGSSLIQRLYHGTLINTITCSQCHNLSERQEDFLDLTVCVRGVSSLEEALWSMFVEEEMFEGNNLYRCSRCDRLVQATKSAKLRKLPPFLTVSLLRFSFDFVKCERFKETRRYSFPLSINLRPFSEQSDQADSELSYELYSVIIHKGGCYGGHYHAYIKDIDQLGHWELPEDDMKQKKQKVQVKPVSVSVCDSAVEKDNPVSLLTAVLAQESGSVLLDQLGQKLMEKIGCSWNKKYRKQHGPIKKFLQSNPDVFVLLGNGSRVVLRNPAETPEQGEEPKSVAERVQEELEAGSDSGLEAEPMSGQWFDLNDSTVTAIRESDIMKQYEGKESAYMLFYRKHTLQRPQHAVGNPAFGVPAHLLQMVQEENDELQQRRAEFEISSNSIDVRLHFASHYCVENGALKLTDKDKDTVTLGIDRRRTVGDLRLAIYQIQDAWKGDLALTIAKTLPAGLHLYDTLTDDQQLLSSAGVYNCSDLFVWNGTEVNGVCVQSGAECEPLLLNILRPGGAELDSVGVVGDQSVGEASEPDASGLVHMMQGFSGGATLGGVREALSLPEALVCQQAKGVGPGGEGGGASRWKVCSPEAMRRTLRELTLRDGDTLLLLPHTHLNNSVFSVSEDVVTVMTPSDCRWLQVEFHTHTTREEEEEKKVMKIPAAGSTLLSEVKQRALEEMQVQEHFTGGVCCLRERDRTGKYLPPVCEYLSVRDAGIKLMTSLCLCPGHSPNASQLFLFFSVAPPTAPELEIIVEQTITVKECLMVMLQKAGLTGTCWHLRRMDWCEEVGEPLTDENASLLDVGVVNGETLVITEGQLPPKGFLRLPVSWFMDQSDCERNQTTQLHTTELQSVGCVEISEEASLYELRCQVLTLPALVQVCVPSPEFLRLWLVERKKLIRILRGNQLTLRKLKLTVGSEVCAQKLQCEENLGLKDILLRLQVGVAKDEVGVSEESAYFPTHEFVWEAGLDSSPRGLYHAVSAHCGISPENLLLAKHQPEQCSWITINYGIQSVSKQKKKKQNKSNGKGVNLQGAPYCLRDGDTIAVKNLLIDSNREFSTGKNEHALREQSEYSRCSERKKNRKAEVALSINVGVFR